MLQASCIPQYKNLHWPCWNNSLSDTDSWGLTLFSSAMYLLRKPRPTKCPLNTLPSQEIRFDLITHQKTAWRGKDGVTEAQRVAVMLLNFSSYTLSSHCSQGRTPSQIWLFPSSETENDIISSAGSWAVIKPPWNVLQYKNTSGVAFFWAVEWEFASLQRLCQCFHWIKPRWSPAFLPSLDIWIY